MRVVLAVLAAFAGFAGRAHACESALSLIEAAEGLRLCEYKDTRGIPTVCYGLNLQDSNACSRINAVGGNCQAVLAGGCLTQSQCTTLLAQDVHSAAADAQSVFGGSVCSCVMNVLTDMTYNLGKGGISSFTTFRSYIEAGQYQQAANDLYSTLWCSQVKSRCTRDAGLIAQGCGSGPNPTPDPNPTPTPAPGNDDGGHNTTDDNPHPSDDGATPTPAPGNDDGGNPTPTPAPGNDDGGNPTPTPAPNDDPAPTPAPNDDPAPTPAPNDDPAPTPAPNDDPAPTPAPHDDNPPPPADDGNGVFALLFGRTPKALRA